MKLRIAVIALVIWAGLGTLSLYCRHVLAEQSGHAVRFPGARTSKDGDIWLGWSVDRRTGFVDGYINGRRDGHNAGCNAVLRILFPKGGIIPNNPGGRCAAGAESFTRGQSLDYVDEITNFYEQYPSDRDIPLNNVLAGISDQQRKTAEQIHQWFLAPPTQR